MKKTISIKSQVIMIAIFIVLGPLLYILSGYNYNLFHLSTEFFTLAVAILIFTITIISRKYNSHSLLERIGYGMLAIAVMTFLHAIAYKDMNIFSGYDSNLPTQLWIGLNYIQAISILVAIVLFEKKIKAWIFIIIYNLSALIIIYLCFAGLFPICFVEGEGLTLFKIISEYVIIFIYLISLGFLFSKRNEVINNYNGLHIALVAFILSEFMFTLYADVYGIQNFLGHYIRLIGLVIIFLNIVVYNIQKPYNTIFSSLKRSESTLMASEEKFRLLVKQMTQGLALHEIILNEEGKPIDYRFLEINQGFEALTGLKHEDVIGKTVLEILPGTEEYWIEKYGKVALTGIPTTFENYSNELEKYFEVSVYSPRINQFATIVNDITGRKNSEKQLKQKNKDLLESQRIAGLGTWRLDLETNEVDWSRELYKIFGFDPTLAPPPYTEHMKLFTFESWDKLSAALERTRILGIPYELELETVINNEPSGWIWVRGEAETNSGGKVIAIWGAARDITEQKKLEEVKLDFANRQNQQQRLESVGTLAGGVAHEINNPLNGIMNYGQLILDSLDKESENAEYAKEIINETNRIAVIVKNLLQFSRYENQGQRCTNIKDIIESVLSLIKTVIKQDQIELIVDIPENLPEVKCNSQQIQQVLLNLLTNARDALNDKYQGHHEEKIIKLYCNQLNKENSRWFRITVEDNGNGIPDSIKEKIFEPFFSSKSRDRGTGLGLYISYGIVKDHHGELTFETEIGQYTKFYLDLPVDNSCNPENY